MLAHSRFFPIFLIEPHTTVLDLGKVGGEQNGSAKNLLLPIKFVGVRLLSTKAEGRQREDRYW